MEKIILNEYQQKLANYYSENNMQRLKYISYQIFSKFGGISNKDYDDFYSIANMVLWNDVQNFDESKGISFENILKFHLRNKFKTAMTKRNRKKRGGTNDRYGSQEVSLDAPVSSQDGNDTNLLEIISNDMKSDMEDQVTGLKYSDRVGKFLDNLSRRNRKIAMYIMVGYDPKDIKRILNISEREYNQAILEFRLYENICILKGGK
jgi:DNA-directed RNA polymerase specialized sigma subunit